MSCWLRLKLNKQRSWIRKNRDKEKFIKEVRLVKTQMKEKKIKIKELQEALKAEESENI